MRTATRATEPARRSPAKGAATTRAALLTIRVRRFAHGSVAPEAQASRSLPTNRGFIRSALSEGLCSNRHCELLEFAVTRRKQTTDTRSKSSFFSPCRNANTPRSSRVGHELRTTNHESRIPPTHAIIKAFICASPQSNGCTEQAITEALKGKNA